MHQSGLVETASRSSAAAREEFRPFDVEFGVDIGDDFLDYDRSCTHTLNRFLS
jgi:hypothetical protein